MVNRRGVNGQQNGVCPDDAELREYLVYLASANQGKLTNDQKIKMVGEKFGYFIGKTKFKELQARLGVATKRTQAQAIRANPAPLFQAVQDLKGEDIGERWGVAGTTSRLSEATGKPAVSRDIMRHVLAMDNADGPSIRMKGEPRPKVHHGHIDVPGLFFRMSADGHEKLGAQALNLGRDVGLAVYGIKDVWSRYFPVMQLLRDARDERAVTLCYLKAWRLMGGLPLEMTTDQGHEFREARGIAYALWADYVTDEYKEQHSTAYTAFQPGAASWGLWRMVESKYNQTSESWWTQLRSQFGSDTKDLILNGKRHFREDLPWHVDLFYFVWGSCVRRQVERMIDNWHHQAITVNKKTRLPTGYSPQFMLDHSNMVAPMSLGWLIPVPAHILEDLWEQYGGDDVWVEKTELVDPAFANVADKVAQTLGLEGDLDPRTAWDRFVAISDFILECELL